MTPVQPVPKDRKDHPVRRATRASRASRGWSDLLVLVARRANAVSEAFPVRRVLLAIRDAKVRLAPAAQPANLVMMDQWDPQGPQVFLAFAATPVLEVRPVRKASAVQLVLLAPLAA